MAAPAAAHPDPADNDGPAQRELRTDGLLDCTVCLEFLHGHVYQCDAGHIICVRCYSQLQPKRCPSCKTMYSTTLPVRNRAVERIAEQAVALGLVPRAPRIPPAEEPRLPRQVFRVRHFTFEREPRRAKVKHGVTCDGPQCILSGKGQIEGVRFLCAECPPSYDLCARCAKDGVHGHHLLIRIDNPSHANQMDKATRNWRNDRLANQHEGQADTRPIARPVRRVVLLRPRHDQPPNPAASSAPNAENDGRGEEDDMDHDGFDSGRPADAEVQNGANLVGDDDVPNSDGEIESEDDLENNSDGGTDNENELGDEDSEIEGEDEENNSENDSEVEAEDEENSENDREGDDDDDDNESLDEDDIFGMRTEE